MNMPTNYKITDFVADNAETYINFIANLKLDYVNSYLPNGKIIFAISLAENNEIYFSNSSTSIEVVCKIIDDVIYFAIASDPEALIKSAYIINDYE